ncbi:MAG TPA: lysophospholipid acyltransferase family protein [Alphaproteobacteria bacterium]|nr:lysophospholipid acyltransferase family protein [Alphaproteobacteria bacterium]
MIFLRSLIFNILFYGFTTLVCIFLVPVLLFSRGAVLGVTKFYLNTVAIMEKYVLGLTYEIRGKEYLPEHGTYIVAAKHQSAYETLKLHKLFGDPTIVLKRELMKIPIFGIFLRKLDVIAIDRGNKEESINAIIEGARRMSQNNRPIVIFPQGTRVGVNETAKDKPYKGGIVKMYSNADLTIIPMALNSGLFWGRNSFIKKPGKITFEFLAPIEPGLPDKKVMKAIEDRLEEHSLALMREAKEKYPYLQYVPVLEAPDPGNS